MDTTQPNDLGEKLADSLNYWLKRLLTFNLIVGFTGAVAFFAFVFPFMGPLEILGVVCWGIMANVAYSMGFVLEALALKAGVRNLENIRPVFFFLGTAAYVVVNFLVCWVYWFGILIAQMD